MGNMIKCIVPIVIIVILLVIGMSLFGGGDSVDVKDVYLSNHIPHRMHSNSQASGVVIFSIVPKTDLTHITSIKLKNVEISYDGYDSDSYESMPLKYDANENDNGGFKYTDALAKNYLYSFYFNFDVTKEGLDYHQNEEAVKSIKHIKADIVIDTTTESNVVIGHIDSDVTFQS